MTPIEIAKQSDHFIVKHHHPALTRSALDQSFSALCELLHVNNRYRCGICDMTAITHFGVSEGEFRQVQLAMTSIFHAVGPNFRFIVAVGEEVSAGYIKSCHAFLEETGVFANAFVTPDLESALAMRG